MQGPAVDIVLLVLLILFFGLQQRSRPQSYFRFWLVGWVFVFLSYVMWEMKLTSPRLMPVQEAVRLDVMLVGVLIFLLSFLAEEERLWPVAARCLVVGLPIVLMIDAKEFVVVPPVWSIPAVMVWEICGLWAASVLIPRGRIKTRLLIYSICLCFAIAMPIYLWMTPGRDLIDWALAEVTLCCAVLYGGGLQRRSVAVYVGMIGFALWSVFYFSDLAGGHAPALIRVVYQFWSFPKYFVGFAMTLKVFEDATEEKAKLAEEMRSMVLGYPYPMWIYEASTGRLLSANKEAERHYGYTEAEFLEMRMAELEHTPLENVDRLLPVLTEGRRTMHRRKDGELIWVHLTDRKVVFHGSDANMLLARDISEKVKLNRELAFRASHDALTGLPNRTLLGDRIPQCMVRCDRDNRKGVLLMIDVDHFKRINDTLGHQFGDECLKVVSARLASKIRQSDTLARVGGEEFAAIIGGLHRAQDVTIITDSLLRVFETPLQMDGCDVTVTVSIGAAIYPDDGVDADTLMRRADEALYAAKKGGRNRAVLASALDTESALATELDLAAKGC